MITIKNDYLEAQFDPKGAEISKLIGMQDGLNYMWKQEPCLWGHSAPVLFPIVGALKNGTCCIDGKEYHMNQLVSLEILNTKYMNMMIHM